MTVRHIDPPPSPLRLVATNTKTAVRDHRYRSGASLYGDARRLYRGVLEHALGSGEQVNPDALRVVLTTKQCTSAEPIARFTGSGIWQLMFVDITAWCRNRHLEVPPGCANAVWATISFLDHTAALAPGSDDLDELSEAIDDCTGGWVDDHPTRRSGRSLPSSRGPKRS